MAMLSGIELKSETAAQVQQVKAAMQHAGLEPKDSVVMMLEVIGREMEKRIDERAEFCKTFSPEFIEKYPSFVKINPFQAGTDFEFIMPTADAESKVKAEVALDKIAYTKVLAEFADVPAIKTLKPETLNAFMKASRESGVGNAHLARPFEVMKKLATDFSIDGPQMKLLRTLSNDENAVKFRHITANHLYPGDLVIQKVEEDERKSGHHTFVPNWTPSERHEQVADNMAATMPELAKMGRFEVATDHKNKSPLQMLADYYNAMAKLQDTAAAMEKEQGIKFVKPQRMVDHVHISNESNMVLNNQETLAKAAGIVNVMDAMVATLVPVQAFGKKDKESDNRIQVNKIGYATDKQYNFMDEKGFALRGVQERKEAGEIQVGHFEVRLGNSFDPFGIVFMTAAAVGGLNKTRETLPEGAIEATEEQYRKKQQGILIGDITAKDAYARLIEDPRLDFIPDKVRHAVLEDKMEGMGTNRAAESTHHALPDTLPPLDNAKSAAATREAVRGRPDNRAVSGS